MLERGRPARYAGRGMARLARRACSLVVVLALLVAAATPATRGGPGCGACAAGCPMHAKGPGCHAARKPACHHGAPAPGFRSGCHRAPDGVEPGVDALRGVVPPAVSLAAILAARDVPRAPAALVTQHVLEPAVDPPRRALA